MNKTLRRMLAFALTFLPLASAWGQNNLINNPGFEEELYGRAKHWQIPSTLAAELTDREGTVRSGTKALAVYQTGGSINAGYYDPNEGIVALRGIQANTKYTFSFWVKAEEMTSIRVFREIYFKWEGTASTTEVVKHGDYGMGIRVYNTDWQEVKVTVTSPATASKVMVSIPILSEGSSNRLFLDDFSLVADAPKVQAPSAPTAVAHQRELDLSWTAIEGATYELQINNKTYTTTSNSLLVTGLVPANDYEIKLRLSKGGTASDWTTTTLRTAALTTTIDEEGRTPYLRTIPESGNCPAVLGLFYNELHSNTATFVYTLDGSVVSPSEQGTLILSKGEHLLQIEVRESDERTYILTYSLNVN